MGVIERTNLPCGRLLSQKTPSGTGGGGGGGALAALFTASSARASSALSAARALAALFTASSARASSALSAARAFSPKPRRIRPAARAAAANVFLISGRHDPRFVQAASPAAPVE